MSGFPLQITTPTPQLDKTRSVLGQSMSATISLFFQGNAAHTFPLWLLDHIHSPNSDNQVWPFIMTGGSRISVDREPTGQQPRRHLVQGNHQILYLVSALNSS